MAQLVHAKIFGVLAEPTLVLHAEGRGAPIPIGNAECSGDAIGADDVPEYRVGLVEEPVRSVVDIPADIDRVEIIAKEVLDVVRSESRLDLDGRLQRRQVCSFGSGSTD